MCAASLRRLERNAVKTAEGTPRAPQAAAPPAGVSGDFRHSPLAKHPRVLGLDRQGRLRKLAAFDVAAAENIFVNRPLLPSTVASWLTKINR
jgi:hypothetical protein